jgi:uncharacterized protein involved in exopolysaccharide biosynthesis
MSRSAPSAPAFPPANGEVELDLKAVGAAIARRWRWIAVPTALAFGGAFLFVNMATPRYASEARLVVENRETPLTRQGGERAGQADAPQPLDQEAIASQVQIIYSRDIARAVIRDLDLTKVPEFDPMVEGRSPVTVALAFLGVVRDVSQMTAEERALEAYYERLSAYPVDRSRVIEIKFQSKDPELAARVANAIAERFIVAQTTAKVERDRRARQHFQRTIDELREQVTRAENRVQEHRARFDLITGVSNQTLGVQTISEINTQLSAAQAQQADAQARAAAIREMLRSGRSIESSEVFASPVIQRLSEQRAQLRTEVAQQATVLLPGHPRMRELNAQLTENEAQMRAQAERIARGLENDARVAGERVGALRRALDQHKRTASAQGDQEVVLRGLEREAKAQRDLLESWLAMYRESSARDSVEVRAADARVVSVAVPSNTPTWPKKLPILLVTTLSSAFAMIALLFTRELVSGRAFVAAPAVAGQVRASEPRLPGAPGGGPGGGLDPRATWEKLARAFVPRFGAARGQGAKRVAVLSAGREEGRAFACALSAGFAAEGRRVVRVEVAAAASEDEAGVGVSDVIAGAASFGEVIEADARSGAHRIGCGRSPASLDEAALLGPRFATLLAALDAAYDHVVLLLPSIVDSDAAAPLAAKCERVVLVAPAGEAADVTDAVRAALEAWGASAVEVARPGAEIEAPIAAAPSRAAA